MSGIQQLLEIMAQLRNPQGGCPWDLEQNFESISPHTIEEAYEVDEAIERGDLGALRDELGDLLFQVVFQARIAEECGAFDFDAVVEAIRSKLIRRHPHVFTGADPPATIEAQTQAWEAIKQAERAAASRAGRPGEAASVADPSAGVPRKLPALARSAKLSGRIEGLEIEAGRAPVSSPQARLELTRRALQRVESAIAGKQARPDRATALALIGEGLQAWVGLARALGVDPEQSLRQADDGRLDAFRKSASPAKVRQAGNSTHR